MAKNIIPKTFYPSQVSLIKWDLDSYADAMWIKIFEFDESQTITEKTTLGGKIANNFEINNGEKQKIGFKFGLVLEGTMSREHTVVTTLASDNLGETIVYFGDKVIVEELRVPSGPYYFTQEYSTGLVSISVKPRRVQ